MKHLFRGFWIVAILLCCSFHQAFAQTQMPPIPVDKNVRIGKLDNGLTYYIRKNSLPANRADFYIAQKVGSIQEEADQRGLAHFLEHMCFNTFQILFQGITGEMGSSVETHVRQEVCQTTLVGFFL